MTKKAKLSQTDLAMLAELDVIGLLKAARTKLVVDGTSVAQLATRAGLSEEWARALENDKRDQLERSAALIMSQAREGAPYVLERMADDAGFLLVPKPDHADSESKDPLRLACAAHRKLNAAIEAFSEVVHDGQVTEAEERKLDAAIREEEKALAGLRNHATYLRVRAARKAAR